MRFLVLTLLGVGVGAEVQNANGGEPLVFISAFASGEQAGIHAFRLNGETGRLRAVHRTTGVNQPFFLAVSPDQKHLYAIDAEQFGGETDEFVAAFELDGRTGKMKLLNRSSARGTASCFLEVDADGRMVLVANYSTGSVAALPILADGSLGEAASFVQHEGSSVNPARQKGPYAHCIIRSPDNHFAFAADLGLDKILCYRLSGKSAGLSPNTQPFVRTEPGAGPRHLTFHPSGDHLFVINELKNSVTMFDYRSDDGLLIERQTISTLPADFEGVTHCADLKITPDGRFLYGTNRGHDSLACYRIEQDGTLELIEITPSLGKGPQNLAITADGKLLLCANMPGHNVAVFRIDGTTGKLIPVGDPLEMPMPSCIRLVEAN